MSRVVNWGFTVMVVALLSGCGYRPSCDVTHQTRRLTDIHPEFGLSGAELLSRVEGARTADVEDWADEATEALGLNELRWSIEGLGNEAIWSDSSPTKSQWFHTTRQDIFVQCGQGMRIPVRFELHHPVSGTRIEGEAGIAFTGGSSLVSDRTLRMSVRLPMDALETDADWMSRLPPAEGEEGDTTGANFEFDEVSLAMEFFDGRLQSVWVEVGYTYDATYRGRTFRNTTNWVPVVRLQVPDPEPGDTGHSG